MSFLNNPVEKRFNRLTNRRNSGIVETINTFEHMLPLFEFDRSGDIHVAV